MNYEQALRILGLKNNFSENDLKKAHRKLANKYHPDRNQSSDAAEKMKDINLARDILASSLKTGPKTYNQTSSYQSTYNPNGNYYRTYSYQNELYNYRKQKIEIINKKIFFDYKKYNVSKNIEPLIKKIEKNRLNFILNVQTRGKDKETIDEIFSQYINKIILDFKELEIIFYKENTIDKENIKESINYDCTLTEFYEQLLKFKEKYNKKEIVKQRLYDEITKYKYFAGYDKITKLIENCLKNTLIEIIQKDYQYTEKDIENMHKNIEKYFEKYFMFSKKISDFETIINSVKDEKIKEYYNMLTESLEKEIDFNNIESYIINFEEQINKYQENERIKTTFENNKQSIDEIYKSLTQKYQKILENYDIEKDTAEIKILNSKLNDILRLFKMGCTEYQNLEFFNLFNDITFENDRQTIKEINNRLKNKNEKIYVRRKDTTRTMNIGDDRCFFLHEELQKKFYRIDQYDVSQIKYNENEQEEFLKNYISLEELLDECIYIGEYKITIFGEKILVLYQSDGYLIYINNDGDICINVNPITRLKDTGEKINYSMFKNKKQIIKIIVNQITKEIDKYKKNSNIYDTINIYNSKKSR